MNIVVVRHTTILFSLNSFSLAVKNTVVTVRKPLCMITMVIEQSLMTDYQVGNKLYRLYDIS